MTDKIKFIDISYLLMQHDILEAKRSKGVFAPRYLNGVHISECSESHTPEAFDMISYVELTRFQCQIIRDNIVEIIRFADTGKM